MLPGLPDIGVNDAVAAGEAFGVGKFALAQFLLIFARMVGLFLVLPFFGSMQIPMAVRVALAATLSAVMTPIIGLGSLPLAANGLMFLGMIVNEILLGLFLGMVCAFVFYAFEAAGRLIDTSRGSSIVDLFDPSTGTQSTPTGRMVMMTATCILIFTGQHMIMLSGLIDSFRLLPANGDFSWIIGNTASIEFFAKLSNDLLVIAVKIAGPTMLSVLMSDTLLGLINRAAPQVNVFMFSLPIKSVLGTSALLFALPIIAQYIGVDPGGVNYEDSALGGLLRSDGSLAQMIEHMRSGESGS